MAVTLDFLAGENEVINTLGGSGLGFFGEAGFGASILVGEFNSRTFCTDSAGTQNVYECDNIKYLNDGSGILGQAGTGISLTAIPNQQCTVAIELSSDSLIQAQNAQVRIYDRFNINNPPSGVTCKVAEIIHPTISQTNNGSGDSQWLTPAGSSVIVDLAPCPGVSGLWAGNGSNSTRQDLSHRWHLAISASPDSVGSKDMFALQFSVEYL